MSIRFKLLAAMVGVALAGALAGSGSAAAAGVESLRQDNPIPEAGMEGGLYRVKESDRKFKRDFPTQPPMVPHMIDKYEISKDKNECLDCHGMENYIEEEATKISQTHYVGREGHHQMSSPDAGRWNCNQCHVTQTDADPLVDNDFASPLR